MTNGGIWPLWGWPSDPDPTTGACPPFIFWPLWLHFSTFRASWAFRPFPRGVCPSAGGESWSANANRPPPNPHHLLPPQEICHTIGEIILIDYVTSQEVFNATNFLAFLWFPQNHQKTKWSTFDPTQETTRSYFAFHWLEPKQSKNGLCGKRGIWFTQEKTNDDWLMTKKWPHRPAWQIETFLVSCTSARCDKGCQNGAFYGNKNPVQSRRVFPLQKTIQSLSIGIILGPGGTMALSNQESCKSAYYTPDQRGCRGLSGRVLLITSSSSFKLAPVVFVFLLVYYLRKHLSFWNRSDLEVFVIFSTLMGILKGKWQKIINKIC